MNDDIEIIEVRLECKGCSTVVIHPCELHSVEEFENFMSKMDPCVKCGHDKADVSLRLKTLN